MSTSKIIFSEGKVGLGGKVGGLVSSRAWVEDIPLEKKKTKQNKNHLFTVWGILGTFEMQLHLCEFFSYYFLLADDLSELITNI